MASTVVLLQHGMKERHAVDPGLTEEGWAQVRRAARVLGRAQPDRIVSSPLTRAQESARPLSDTTDLPVLIDERVRERMEFDPQVWDSIPAFLAEWDRATQNRAFAPTTGDSSHVAAARMTSAVIDHASQAGFVVIATHGGVTVDFLRTQTSNDGVDPQFLSQGMPNGHLTTLRVTGREVEVLGTGVAPESWTLPTPVSERTLMPR